MVFSTLGKSLSGVMRKLMGKGVVDEALIKELKNEIFKALLEADVDFDIAYAVAERVEQRSLTEPLPKGITRRQQIINIVYEELTRVMGEKPYPLNLQKGRPNIVLMVGIQGSGKTTTTAKLARYLSKQGWKVGLVAADTWRPGAYDQLKQLGEKIGVEVYGDPKEKNAIKLAKKGRDYFIKQKKNVIIIDTAGRHKEESSLIKEMKKLNRELKPHEVILVIDGTLGQAAFGQASAFARATKVGSVIVTKLDGTAKGGGAISASVATGAPIKFIGIGEKIDDLERYDPKRLVSRILGLGDLETLLEEVKQAQIDTSEEQAKAIMKGKFTLRDMMDMMEQMNKMGGIKKLMSMIPGMSMGLDDNMLQMSKESLERFKIIMSSMTDEELDGKVKINRSRQERIARGSGVTLEDIRSMLQQYEQSKKMVKTFMKQSKRRGAGGQQIPGIPGFPPGAFP